MRGCNALRLNLFPALGVMMAMWPHQTGGRMAELRIGRLPASRCLASQGDLEYYFYSSFNIISIISKLNRGEILAI